MTDRIDQLVERAARLNELADQCKASQGPDRELDLDVWWWGKANGGSSNQPMPEDYRRSNLRMNDAPRYTASLDAAKTLWPGEVPHLIPSDPRICAAMALRARAHAVKENG